MYNFAFAKGATKMHLPNGSNSSDRIGAVKSGSTQDNIGSFSARPLGVNLSPYTVSSCSAPRVESAPMVTFKCSVIPKISAIPAAPRSKSAVFMVENSRHTPVNYEYLVYDETQILASTNRAGVYSMNIGCKPVTWKLTIDPNLAYGPVPFLPVSLYTLR